MPYQLATVRSYHAEMSDGVVITFAPRPSELLRVRLRVAWQARARLLFTGLLITGVISLALSLSARRNLWYWLVLWAIYVGLLVVAVLMIFLILNLQPGSREARTYTFTQVGMASSTVRRRRQATWQEFKLAYDIPGGQVLMMKDSRQVVWVPNRAFTSPNAARLVAEWIREGVSEARVTPTGEHLEG